MPSLTDVLAAPPTRTCNFDAWFQGLADDEQKSVIDALANPEWSTHKLFDIFKDHGLRVTRDSVAKHRQGKCLVCQSQ